MFSIEKALIDTLQPMLDIPLLAKDKQQSIATSFAELTVIAMQPLGVQQNIKQDIDTQGNNMQIQQLYRATLAIHVHDQEQNKLLQKMIVLFAGPDTSTKLQEAHISLIRQPTLVTDKEDLEWKLPATPYLQFSVYYTTQLLYYVDCIEIINLTDKSTLLNNEA